ncbi:hypothetical protein BH11PSE7_BH11PSE7_06260 [soil metagenome]
MRTAATTRIDAPLKVCAAGVVVLMLALPATVLAEQKRLASAGLAGAAAHASQVAFAPSEMSGEARQVAAWAMYTGDTKGMPFLILDKVNATIHVFGVHGRLLGSSPVLLGSAIGDESVYGIGDRDLADIKPAERTTPAGRFVTTPGRNSHGEDIVWVDYDAAVSMHRVRASVKAERRLERLASPTPDDNRISFGCINMPPNFYNTVVRPLLGNARGIVYILPETRAASAQFGSFDVPASPAVAAAVPAAAQAR